MRQYSENLAVVAVACLLFSMGVLAQNTARSVWQGILRDAAGLPIHGAGVHLKGVFVRKDHGSGGVKRCVVVGVVEVPVGVNDAFHRRIA